MQLLLIYVYTIHIIHITILDIIFEQFLIIIKYG